MTDTKPNVDPTGQYSIANTAKHLNVGVRSIQRWVKDGRMKAKTRKIDSKRYISGLEIIKAWNSMY